MQPYPSSTLARIVTVTAILLTALATHPAPSARAADPYPRAGWTTQLSTLAHGVRGTATIVDAHTIVLSNFDYDGGGPRVFAYLGMSNTNTAFQNGLPIGPLLTRSNQPYVSETLTLTLPISQTLDDYSAISIWCADFNVNFGSGNFIAPTSTYTLFLPFIGQ